MDHCTPRPPTAPHEPDLRTARERAERITEIWRPLPRADWPAQVRLIDDAVAALHGGIDHDRTLQLLGHVRAYRGRPSREVPAHARLLAELLRPLQ